MGREDQVKGEVEKTDEVSYWKEEKYKVQVAYNVKEAMDKGGTT